jgi:hypothetical protein
MVYVSPREYMSLEGLELEENEDKEEAQGENSRSSRGNSSTLNHIN